MKKVMKLVLGMMILGTVLVSCKTNADSHDHTYSEEWSSDETGHWHKATCEHTDEVADKAEHTFGEWIVKKAATEEEKGSKEKVCSVCNYKQTEEIAKLDHVHAIGVKHDAVAATCTVDGNVEYYDCVKSGCTAKLDAEGKEIPSVTVVATGHTENTGTVITPPTLVTKGERTFSCTGCNAVIRTEEIAALGWCETAIDAETYKKATDSSKYVYFGVFPQTVLPVTGEDLETVDESDSVTMGANVYYNGSKGNWYAKCNENPCDTGYIYSDGTESKKNVDTTTTRYFKVEPIKWRVLDTKFDYDGENGSETAKLIVAENILTGNIRYYETDISTRTIETYTNIYPNNYMFSQIRAYLNGLNYYNNSNKSVDTYTDKGFLQTAFTSTAQEEIKTTEVNNKVESTKNYDIDNGVLNGTSTFACENTQDKIFLLSEYEVTKYSTESFKASGEGNSRIRFTTDYAKANKVYNDSRSWGGGHWWLRSPLDNNYHNKYNVLYVGASGNVNEYFVVNNSQPGIVPALTISFTQD